MPLPRLSRWPHPQPAPYFDNTLNEFKCPHVQTNVQFFLALSSLIGQRDNTTGPLRQKLEDYLPFAQDKSTPLLADPNVLHVLK